MHLRRLQRLLVPLLALVVAGAVVGSSAAERDSSAGKGKPKPTKTAQQSAAAVAIADPQAGFATNAGSLSVTVTFAGATAKDSVDLRVNGVDAGSWPVPSHTSFGSHAFTVDLSSRAEGGLSLVAVLSDGHHSASSTTVAGVLDRTPPTIASDAPAGWGKAPLTVHLTATDPGGSGVAKTCWTIDGGSEGCTGSASAAVVLTAGTHQLGYHAVDGAGNAGTEETATVKVDGSAPTTTADAPSGWVQGPVTVTLAATDGDSGVATTSYVLDGNPGYGTSILVGGDGQHTLSYFSTDAAGNQEALHTTTVNIDDGSPVTTSAAPSGFIGTPSTVPLTATDAESGVTKTCWSIDGGTQACNVASGDVTTLSTAAIVPAGTGDGAHTLTYYSVDNAGNVEAPHTAPFRVDATAPTATATLDPPSPTAQNGWYNPGPVTVTLAATDGDAAVSSGVAKLCYQLDGGAATCDTSASTTVTVATDGAHVVTYHAVDNAGNSENDQTVDVDIDSVVPKIASTLSPAQPQIAGSDWFSGVTVHFNCSDATSGVAFCTSDKALLDGANQTVSGLATDQAGNAASTTLAGINVDRTLPTITSAVLTQSTGAPAVLSPTGWYTDLITVQFACADALSGVFSCSVPVALGNGGGQSVTGTTTDKAGNTRSDTVGPLNVDTVPPTISAALVPLAPDGDNGWFTSATVHWTCGDATSGVASCPADDVLADGANQRPAGLATDVAGNTTPLELAPINVDGTAPVTTPGIASGPYSGSSLSVPLRATDSVSGVVQTCYTVDGGPQTCQTAAPGSELDVDVPVTGVGAHTVQFHSTDAAGNVESQQTLALYLDNTAPATSDDSPASGWAAGTSTELDLHATDSESGVAKTCYKVDTGSQTCAAPGAAAASFVVPVPVSGTGVHTVKYFSVDAAGNTESAHTVSIGLDATAPATNISNPASDWTQGPATISFMASDSGSGVGKTCYTLGVSSGVCGSSPVSFQTNAEGDQTLSYYSVDLVGNTETVHTVHVKIDNTPPTISINGNWDETADQLRLSCTPGDALSGVDSSTLSLHIDAETAGGCSGETLFAAAGFSYDVTVTGSDFAGNETTVEAMLSDGGGSLRCVPIQGADACGTITTQG